MSAARGTPFEARWSGVDVRDDGEGFSGFITLPVALLKQADALGLDDGKLRLLLALEAHRRDGEDAVFPSQARLAKLCGCSESQVQRRVRDLRALGLIETERRARYGGKRLLHYTRHGLTRRLAELTAKADTDPAPTRGTEESDPASTRGSNPAPVRGTNPASTRGKAEEVEAEAGKQNAPGAPSPGRLVAYFNETAGTDYSERGSYAGLIAERIEENPGLTEADYRAAVDVVFRDPWWDDVPSPRVVFSAAQFEQAREAARSNEPLAEAAQPRDVEPSPGWDGLSWGAAF